MTVWKACDAVPVDRWLEVANRDVLYQREFGGFAHNVLRFLSGWLVLGIAGWPRLGHARLLNDWLDCFLAWLVF